MNDWLPLVTNWALTEWLHILLTIIGNIFIIAGCFFIITGAVGMLRMPDFFARLHPAGVSDAVGAPFILMGIALQTFSSFVILKILLLTLFILITSPAACHALAKAALTSGLRPIGTIHKKPSHD